jgi:mono/diheme cytochrome c family protein
MKKIFYVLLPALLLTACDQQPSTKGAAGKSQSTTTRVDKVERDLDFAVVTRGGKLFCQYCADCHGLNAQGAQNWRQRRPDGSFPASPLDGTGHAWHHPKKVLQMTIRKGTTRMGGSMPAWGKTLDAQDIDAIIAWFQAKWPDEIYAEWQRRNAASLR